MAKKQILMHTKIIVTLPLVILICQCYTFNGLPGVGKKLQGVQAESGRAKFVEDKPNHEDNWRTDAKYRIIDSYSGIQVGDLKQNKNQQKLIWLDQKNWRAPTFKGSQGRANQVDYTGKEAEVQLKKSNYNQKRRLTSFNLGSPVTINNFYESPYTRFFSSSSRFTSAWANPPNTHLPQPPVLDEIAYNQYLKNSFPSLPNPPTSPPTPTVISTNFKTDEAINNLFSNIIKNLQVKMAMDNQNIITNTHNQIQSSTKTSFATQTTPSSTPATTSSTNTGNSTNSTSRPNIGSKINQSASSTTAVPPPTSSTLKLLPSVPLIQVPFKSYLSAINPFFFVKAIPQTYYYRQKIYLEFLAYINRFNQQRNRTYNMGLNQFTYLSQQQFTNRYLKAILPQTPTNQNSPSKSATNLPNINIDWRCKASAVILSSQCITSHINSVFQAIHITQGIYNISRAELSVQEILSCGTDLNLKGCDGGYYSAVYDYVEVFGVGLNRAYPFQQEARTNRSISECSKAVIGTTKYMKNKIFVTSGRINSDDCEQVVRKLQSRAISVTIASKDLRFYKEGTYNSSSIVPDHKVTLVGYDPQNRFLIKNVWGAQWGIQGYAYVSQYTGVCNHAMYPILQKQGKPTQCSQ